MLRPATLNDAVSLAPRLRAADKAELRACGHLDTEMVLIESIVLSDEAWAYEAGGKVLALMGVVGEDTYGVPWLLGSDELFNHRKAIMQLPFEYVPRWVEKYGKLMNIVHTGNHRSVRWLKYIGFTLGEPVQFNGHFFYPFTMSKPHV